MLIIFFSCLVKINLVLAFKTRQIKKEEDFQLYSETRWDPLSSDPELQPIDREQHIRTVAGYFSNHNQEVDINFKRFGDISIITLNLFREIIADYETVQSSDNVHTILDEAHPSFLCLQGVDDTLLTRINNRLKDQPHYKMTTYEKYNTEMLSAQKTYLPIIYDTTLFSIHRSGYFESEPPHKMRYASFVQVKDRRFKNERISFTVINVDLFSSFNDVVNAQFSNINSDIISFKEVQSLPVFIVGGFGTIPPNIYDLMKTYKNSIEDDDNNKDIPNTTIHAGSQEDNIQRDFILLRDEHHVFELNYARILRDYLASDHYPVHSIYSYKNKTEKLLKKEKVADSKSN